MDTAQSTNRRKQESELNKWLHLTQILPADYKLADILDIVQRQTHISPDKRNKLSSVLYDFQELFSGKRGLQWQPY